MALRKRFNMFCAGNWFPLPMVSACMVSHILGVTMVQPCLLYDLPDCQPGANKRREHFMGMKTQSL